MLKGLTENQVAELRKDYGLNTILSRSSSTILVKFIEQFKSFLPILLIFASILSFYIGEKIDGFLIVTIVLLNAGFGVYQENKAEEAVAALKQLSISTIRVIRDGKERELDSSLLVPGDIIFIEEGVKIPADAILRNVVNLEVNEASLTGESIAVIKAENDQIFMGTIVARGRAIAEVVKTGMNTKFGQIADKLMAVEEGLTPLQKKLAHITEIIGLVGIIASLIVFVLSIIRGEAYFPSFLLSISFAIAVVPESLPAVMTVILSIGVKRMATQKAIVRRLASIEALGSATLIATDKTGTLTQNKMNVKEIWLDGECIDDFKNTKSDSSTDHMRELILNGILCSTASLVNVHDHDKTFDVLGDPTEGALLLLGKECGYEPEVVRSEYKIVDEAPFNSEIKRMSVLVENSDKSHTLFVKGAPESILEISSSINGKSGVIVLNEKKKEQIYSIVNTWAKQGLRILAFSTKSFKEKGNLKSEDTVFIGMVAMYDPPREEAHIAINRANAAGIKVVMITGDNEKTAEAIGTTIGLVKKGDLIVRGDQIESYSDNELMALLPHVKIFARINPFHKSRIVSLYQKMGEIVVVTGDGVNDAIALKQADVGVAMGRVGTDVARETADMIITDDNFATIVTAIEEGRNIVKRLKNSLRYLFTGNLAEALTLIVGLLLGLPPIFIPIQILYINLISDGIPALAMAFTPKDIQVMSHPPERKMSLLTRNDYRYIFFVAGTVMCIVIGGYLLMPGSIEAKRAIAFTIMAIIQAFIFVDIWLSHLARKQQFKSLLMPIFLITLFSPIFLQIIMTMYRPISEVFHINTLTIVEFIACFVISGSILLFFSFIRHVRYFTDNFINQRK